MTNMRHEKSAENQTKGHVFQVLCPHCKSSTRHQVAVSYDKEGAEWNREEEWRVSWEDHYQVIECQGCLTTTFRHSYCFSENQEPGDDGIVERLYPIRSEGNFIAKPHPNVPIGLRRIYGESIDCLNSESNTLCAAGLRALVEGICSDQQILDGPVQISDQAGKTQIIRKKDLAGRIAGLHEKGLLIESEAQILHEHRYMGNEAVHTLARPSTEELTLALQIVEHILDSLYEMPEKAAKLRARRKT